MQLTLTETLHRASRIADKYLSHVLADSELTPRSFTVLRSLIDGEPRSQTVVATATGIDRSTLNTIVTRLVSLGFLTAQRQPKRNGDPDGTDGRVSLLAITAAGTKAVSKFASVGEYDAPLMAGTGERKALTNILSGFAEPVFTVRAAKPVKAPKEPKPAKPKKAAKVKAPKVAKRPASKPAKAKKSKAKKATAAK